MRISLSLMTQLTTALRQLDRAVAHKMTLHLTEMTTTSLNRAWNPRLLLYVENYPFTAQATVTLYVSFD
jgi:hypothetical protein